MYPTKEQAQAYFEFMSKLPKFEETPVHKAVKCFLFLMFFMPLFLFCGSVWFELSPVKVSDLTFGFLSCTMAIFAFLIFYLTVNNVTQKSMPDKWVELVENSLKRVVKVKTPMSFFGSFMKAKTLILIALVYAISVNLSVTWAGWFLFFILSMRYLTVETNNFEIATIGQKIIEGKFKPKHFAFVDKK